MSGHTPGPWTIDRQNWPFELTGRYHRVISDERFPTAFIPGWSEPAPGEVDGTEEAKANARLIAAAPELYEALGKIAAFAPGNGDECEVIAKIARAAIAKVES